MTTPQFRPGDIVEVTDTSLHPPLESGGRHTVIRQVSDSLHIDDGHGWWYAGRFRLVTRPAVIDPTLWNWGHDDRFERNLSGEGATAWGYLCGILACRQPRFGSRAPVDVVMVALPREIVEHYADTDYAGPLGDGCRAALDAEKTR